MGLTRWLPPPLPLLLLLLPCAAGGGGKGSSGPVFELHDANFDDALAANPTGLLVEFYAPWCGHCKALQPEYEAAATALSKQKKTYGSPLRCAAVDAAKNTDLARRYSITGYPWVKLFLPDAATGAIDPAAKPLNYPDSMPRESGPMVTWALQKSGRLLKPVEYTDGLTKLRTGAAGSGKLLVLGVFGPADEEGLAVGLAELRALSADDEVGGLADWAVHHVPSGQRLSPLTEALCEEVFSDIDPIDRAMADDPDEFAIVPPALLIFSMPAGGDGPAKPVVVGAAALSVAVGSGGDRYATPEVVAAELRGLYERQNPRRLDELPALLQKYAGSEAELLAAARGKYGETGAVGLKQALARAVLPSPCELTNAIRPWIFAHPAADLAALFYDPDQQEGDAVAAAYAAEFEAAAASGAAARQDRLLFVRVDTRQFRSVAERYGVSRPAALPALRIVGSPAGFKTTIRPAHVHVDKEAGAAAAGAPQSVSEFVEAFLAGAGTPDYAGQPEPEDDDREADGLPEVVRSTFEAKVLEAGGPVVLAVHKPGCAACASLEPVLTRLQHEMAQTGVPALPILGFDGSNNNVLDKSGLMLQAESFPTLAVFDPKSAKKHPEDPVAAVAAAGMSVKEVATWLGTALPAGGGLATKIAALARALPEKMDIDYKSAKPPKKPAAAGEVAVVVGTTFESVVAAGENDVLVELYAPWCGHCKALAPLYDGLARAMAPLHPQVTIAKMDLTANEVKPELLARPPGYPTVRLYKKQKGGRKAKRKASASPADGAVDYDGDRESVQSFLDFLAKEGTVDFTVTRENGDGNGPECDASGCLLARPKVAIDKSEL
eukprot:SAG22_NODE_1658_length_3877_cov_3.700635_1_plen_835_part_00